MRQATVLSCCVNLYFNPLQYAINGQSESWQQHESPGR